MRDFKSKRYWLIGASEGLGAALAHELSAAGADLILSARNEEALHALAESLPGQAEVVPIDVRDMDSVERAAHSAGSLDGLVYLAGVYWPFAAQAWHVEQTIAMCDVNFTGATRVLGQVVPQFVAKDSGHIVITGSIGGFRGLPSAIGYNASKAGVMTLAESLYCDLRQSGVCVQLANPKSFPLSASFSITAAFTLPSLPLGLRILLPPKNGKSARIAPSSITL